jgi:hypothetical protein
MTVLSSLGALGEVGLALLPWAPAPRPSSAAGVEPAWLAEVLADDAVGVRIEGLAELGGTAGTTDRRRIGVQWNDAGAAAGLPTSVFIKSTAGSAKNRAMVAALWMAVNEVKFYEQVRPALGDVAPVAYASHAGHGARFLIVLEDLVARGAEPWSLQEECTLEHARGVITALAQLHARFWESPRLQSDLRWAAPMTQRPGFALLANQFRRVRRRFLAEADERQVGPAVRRMIGLLNEHDKALYRSWETGPQTFVHGDSHLGNTYRLPDGRAGLLDWQVVFQTRGIREVSYFVCAGLPTELRRAHERELVQHYLATLASEGVTNAPSEDEAWEDYRFFIHDAWDSTAITVLWRGLQPEEAVARAHERARTAVEDLAVDEVVAARVGAA